GREAWRPVAVQSQGFCGFAVRLIACCFVADANISDESLVRRALDLAREGIGLTSPNPCVGAVVVDGNGVIVGTGVYEYDALKHAEVLALEQAGEKARGATLY